MSKTEKTDTMTKILKWINYNRFVVIGPILGLIIWFSGWSCTPLTESLLNPGRMINESQLVVELKTWKAQQEIFMIKFEAAGEDIAQQKENNKKLEAMVLDLASGGIPDMAGLVKLVFGGLALGAGGDNIRKRGLIAGLKINNKKS